MFRIEFFVQGRGWVGMEELLGWDGSIESERDAMDIAASLIEERMRKSEHPYGSRIGDVVGFRLVKVTNGKALNVEKERKLSFRDVSHKYFRRGEAFMLYKSWSWPD